MPEIKETIDQLKTTFAEWQASMSAKFEAMAKNNGVGELTAKVEKITEAYDKIKEDLDAEHIERQRERALGGIMNGMNKAERTYMGAVAKYMRSGDTSGIREAEASLQIKNDPNNGFFLAPTVSGRLVEMVAKGNPMRQLATVETIGGNEYSLHADLAELTAEWDGEVQLPATGEPKRPLKETISAHKLGVRPKVSSDYLDDSVTDLEAWLLRKASRAFTNAEREKFVTGTGVKCPRGFLTYPLVANATFEADVYGNWGKFGYIKSGHATSIPDADCLIALTDALDDVYLANAVWQMKKSTFTAIRQFKMTKSVAGDQAYSLWTPSFQPGKPDQLLGYDVYRNDAFPAIGANVSAIAFGDFAAAYTIVDRQGIAVLRDPYSSKPFVEFYTTKRVGAAAVDFNSAKILKIEAA